jgi:hypothetical protein
MNLCAEDAAVRPKLELERPVTGPEPFGAAIERVEQAVLASCGEQREWPARIAAGIGAAVDFLIANPAAARTLTVDSRSGGGDDSDYLEMIARFAGLLSDGAPRSERLPASSDRSVVTVIAAIVSCHVRAGTIDSLGGDPDLVFLALLPYVGFAEAARLSTSLSR